LADVRVIPHVIFVTGAPGFDAYQQLIRGTIEQAVQVGQLSATEVETWWASLEQAAQAQTFFSANLGFAVAGLKP
jgi:hypothetical protein